MINSSEKTLKNVTETTKPKTEKKSKHFPSSVREWNNSIYVYNKNNLSLIPSTTVSAMKIIKSFFSVFNQSLERKIRTKRLLLRLRRLSSNRIYLSNGEFKHKNNRVLVNIYIFNRQKNNYLSKLRNIYFNNFFTKNKKINTNYIKTLRSILMKGFESLSEINKDKYLLIKILDIVKLNRKYKIKTFKKLSNYTGLFYKNVSRFFSINFFYNFR